MKKYISMLFIALAATFTSCDTETDEEAGGTAVEKMAGTWTVTFEQSVDEYYYIFEDKTDPNLKQKTADELANMEWEDVYGKGKVTVMTSNTASNTTSEMWYYDNSFSKSLTKGKKTAQVKLNIDYANRTFNCTDKTGYDGCNVNIIGGKILEGAATTPRGMKADSIVAYVSYSNQNHGFTYMKMSGYRYTGFNEDK